MKVSKMVLGFMFNENETDVLLIEKKRPVWQKGKFNGIGGKVEEGENSFEAMKREFREETGIEQSYWRYIVTMSGNDWSVDVFTCKSGDIWDYKSMEEEAVILASLDELDKINVVSNLYWLIPMCLDGIDYRIANCPVKY
jgi:8-oxo-dGTP diphosphatase